MNQLNAALGIVVPEQVISTNSIFFNTLSQCNSLNKLSKSILALDIDLDIIMKDSDTRYREKYNDIESLISRALSISVDEEAKAKDLIASIDSHAEESLKSEINWIIRRLDYEFFINTNRVDETVVAGNMLHVINNLYFMLSKVNDVLQRSNTYSAVHRALYTGMKDFIGSNHDMLNAINQTGAWLFMYNATSTFSEVKYEPSSGTTGYKQVDGIWRYYDKATVELNARKARYLDLVFQAIDIKSNTPTNLSNLKKDFDQTDLSKTLRGSIYTLTAVNKEVDTATMELGKLIRTFAINVDTFEKRYPDKDLSNKIQPLVRLINIWLGTLISSYEVLMAGRKVTHLFTVEAICLNYTVDLLRHNDTLKMLIKGI